MGVVAVALITSLLLPYIASLSILPGHVCSRSRSYNSKIALAASAAANANDVDVDVDVHKRVYSMPALYDMAFGYRDFDEEVEFLLNAHKKISGFKAHRILDIAAGPARHGITALQLASDKDNLSVTCVDLSPEMAEYAQELAIEGLMEKERSNFHYIIDDIRTFDVSGDGNADQQFDSAWILLGSLQHLTKNSEVVQCLSRIHQVLRPNGTVIIELPHPRETFSMVDCTRNSWNVPLEDENDKELGELRIVWGDDDDEFDPITQVRQLTIEMKLTGADESDEMQSVRGVVPTRLFTVMEVDAIAQLSGFKVAASYGALEEGVAVDDEIAAFRLVSVLQKV
eukprot:CAMPEP_0198136418 /NCGR_PEP_ID=MMETSP1443-20131203/68_1 /TAXON_ID=186043 /ORGANISM="Entomoneis sp., Strain CCMP2396" /LENGTH=340 /DNA_ID=CAMNT_0043797633 /DNA_START=38 /DNA_END=1060 /DNA_ORIENTATION=+